MYIDHALASIGYVANLYLLAYIAEYNTNTSKVYKTSSLLISTFSFPAKVGNFTSMYLYCTYIFPLHIIPVHNYYDYGICSLCIMVSYITRWSVA